MAETGGALGGGRVSQLEAQLTAAQAQAQRQKQQLVLLGQQVEQSEQQREALGMEDARLRALLASREAQLAELRNLECDSAARAAEESRARLLCVDELQSAMPQLQCGARIKIPPQLVQSKSEARTAQHNEAVEGSILCSAWQDSCCSG